MNLILDVLLDAALDSIRMLPFLFGAFLLIESLEHYSTAFVNRMLIKLKKAGPVIGAAFGCIPQCGFSVMAANLYSSGVITLGTLAAVFLSTSDEAVLILLGHPGQAKTIWSLLLIKLILAIICGYLLDLFFGKKISSEKHIGDLCAHCGCHSRHGIFLPALNHTLRLFGYIFLFSTGLTLLIELVGADTISSLLLGGSIFQPFLTGIIGFIPNCAASVMLTELYLNGAISFASVIAGLCTNSGMGLIVLFKVNKNRKENMQFAGILYLVSVTAALIIACVLR